MSITSAHDWTDVVAALGTGAGALAATAALVYAGRQLQLGRRSAEQERQSGREQLAYRYFERLMHPDMIRLIERWVELSKLGNKNPDRRWRKWRRAPLRYRLETLVVPNLLEELAGMYHLGLVDHKVADEFLGAAIVDWWEQGEWFIRRYRIYGSDDLYAQWERLYKNLKETFG